MNLSDPDTLKTLWYTDTSCLILILLHAGTISLSIDFILINMKRRCKKN